MIFWGPLEALTFCNYVKTELKLELDQSLHKKYSLLHLLHSK